MRVRNRPVLLLSLLGRQHRAWQQWVSYSLLVEWREQEEAPSHEVT